MSNEKKIIFSGQDNISQTTKQVYNNILSEAKKYSDSLKEQTGYINSQIKALEQKAKLENKNNLRSSNDTLRDIRNMAPGLDKNKAFISYHDSKKNIESTFTQESKTIEVLKNILQETKKQSTTSEKAEKSLHINRLSSEEQNQSMKSLARQEFRENKQGVLAKIKNAEKSDYAGLNPQAAEKLMYQKTLAGEEKKSKSIIGEVFTGTFLAGIATQIVKSLGQVVGTRSGEDGLNTLLSHIPIYGAAKARSFEEQYGVQSKEMELSARTGSNINSLGGLENIGYSNKESLNMIGGMIDASGKSNGGDQAGKGLMLQRGLGLSQEVITQIVKDIRTTGSATDIMKIASDVLAANPELRKDQTKFAEILQQTSQLTNQLASQSENVDPRNSAGIVGALRSIGGSFQDSNLGPQRMMSINNALTNPGTDYQKSRAFGVLSGLNPGASHFQMLEAQEQGLGHKGYLGGMLKQFGREAGSNGENAMMNIHQNFPGLGASTSRKLWNDYQKNPNKYNNWKGSEADIEKEFGGLQGRAESYTAKRDKDSATIDNAFLKDEFAGTITVAKLVGASIVDAVKENAVTISKELAILGIKLDGMMKGESEKFIKQKIDAVNKLYEH